ncbi:NADH-quinone oxidoreductase subunit F [Candidatus Hepatincolaceae symbiont of Richtersius coronifer]
MLSKENIIFNNIYGQRQVSLDSAKYLGDFIELKEVLQKGPQFIISEITSSDLKGRGGAGFPTGKKLSFLADIKGDKPKYLVINGDEGEPGTCKDREVIRHEPFKILEGCIVVSHAIGAKTCYIYIRGEFYQEAQVLQKAIDQLYAQGLLGKSCLSLYDLDIYIHLGAGAYICGEETALLESLEGKKGFPRIKPPFPALIGLYGCPTLINNIETIATIPTILKRGAQWFSSLGVLGSTGTKLFCISGHVNNPCVVEEEMGIPLKDLIEKHAKDVIGGWSNLLAVIPGGSSTQILPKNYCDKLTMDFDSLRNAGSALGTGAIIVFNNSTNILGIMRNIINFYHHESCGQCTPCREGSGAALKIVNKFVNKNANINDINTLEETMQNILGTSICGLNDATVFAVQGFLKHYKDYIKDNIENR